MELLPGHEPHTAHSRRARQEYVDRTYVLATHSAYWSMVVGTFWGFVMGTLMFALIYCMLAGDRRGVIDLLGIATILGALLYLRASSTDGNT